MVSASQLYCFVAASVTAAGQKNTSRPLVCGEIKVKKILFKYLYNFVFRYVLYWQNIARGTTDPGIAKRIGLETHESLSCIPLGQYREISIFFRGRV